MTQRTQVRRGPPLGRHAAAVGLILVLMPLFWWLDSDRSLPISHALLADTSLALLCLILMLGALARFVPKLRPVVPWGRELGIGMFVTAGLHVALLLDPDFFDVIPDIGQQSNTMWTAAWWVGLLALAYALVLAATSNDWSQRTLGRGWKFLQRQTYTLFVLTWLHTAAYVLLGAGHGALLGVWLFWGLSAAALLSQFAGFVHTVRAPRGPSPYRVPPKADAAGSTAVSFGATRWLGVMALWGAVVLGSWMFANVESAEERQVALLCDRYNELGRPPISGPVRTELVELLPPDWEPTEILETVGECPDG